MLCTPKVQHKHERGRELKEIERERGRERALVAESGTTRDSVWSADFVPIHVRMARVSLISEALIKPKARSSLSLSFLCICVNEPLSLSLPFTYSIEWLWPILSSLLSSSRRCVINLARFHEANAKIPSGLMDGWRVPSPICVCVSVRVCVYVFTYRRSYVFGP